MFLLIFGIKCDQSLHVFNWFQLQEGIVFLNVVFIQFYLLSFTEHLFLQNWVWAKFEVTQSYEQLLCQNICTVRCAAGSQVSHWEINMVFKMNRDFINTLTPFKSKPRSYCFHCTDNAKSPYKVKGMLLYIWECIFKREMRWVKRTFLLSILQILSPFHLVSSFITAPLSFLSLTFFHSIGDFPLIC